MECCHWIDNKILDFWASLVNLAAFLFGCKEGWTMIFRFLTSIGTIGAVWLALHGIILKNRRFALKYDAIEQDEKGHQYLIIEVDNFMDLPLVLHTIRLSIKDENDKVLHFKNSLRPNYRIDGYERLKMSFNLSADFDRTIIPIAKKLIVELTSNYGTKNLQIKGNMYRKVSEILRKPSTD